MARRRLLITAGPTREKLDPVRYLTNQSTGQMGYALAEAGKKQGYQVTLITGPTALRAPRAVRLVSIESAAQLKRACEKHFPQNDILIMTAAVCDFTPVRIMDKKIHRSRGRTVHFRQTPDIVAGLAKKKSKEQTVIGFCLETEDWITKAKGKLRRKRLDGIVANYLDKKHNPFGARNVKVALLEAGKTRVLSLQSKNAIAKKILRWIEEIEVSKRLKSGKKRYRQG